MMWRETLLSVVLAVSSTAFLAGQDLPSSIKALAAKAREAAKAPPSKVDSEPARAELQKAIEKFNAFLHTSPDRQKIDRWQKYLQWADLKAAAKGEKTSSESAVRDLAAKIRGENTAKRRVDYVAELRKEYDPKIDDEDDPRVLAKLVADFKAKVSEFDKKTRAENDSLSRTQLLQIGENIADYSTVADAAANSALAEEYPKRLEEIATQLEALTDESKAADAAKGLSNNVGWLESNRQSPELVNEIRQTFSQPNFLGYVSRDFAAVGMNRNINQVNVIDDNILGTSMHGTARMIGKTELEFNENPAIASMNILLKGTAWSNNVGYRRPVTIYSTGVSSIRGSKTIWMDAEGLHEYASKASCGTRSNINDICARCGLVERIAWKKAGQQQGQGEAIASQHASARVAQGMNDESRNLIRENNEKYNDGFRNPLQRSGQFPDELVFSTTHDRANVRMRQESRDMLAALAEPPDFAKDHDLGARTHESAVINYGRATLAGKYLDDRRIEEILRDEMKREVPEDMQVTLPNGKLDPDKDPWAMTFADDQPLRVKFRKSAEGAGADELWIAIQLKEVYRGQRTIGGPYSRISQELVEVGTTYEIVPIEGSPDRLKLHRKTDITVRFLSRANPDQRIVSRGDTVVVPLLIRKFRNLFKPDMGHEGFTLEGQFAKAGKLWITEASSNSGWLKMGLEADKVQTAPPVAAGGE